MPILNKAVSELILIVLNVIVKLFLADMKVRTTPLSIQEIQTIPALFVADTLLMPNTILRLNDLKENPEIIQEEPFAIVPIENEKHAKLLLEEKGSIYGLLCNTPQWYEDPENGKITLQANIQNRISIFVLENGQAQYKENPIQNNLDENSSHEMTLLIQRVIDEIAEDIQGGTFISKRAAKFTSLGELMMFLAPFLPFNSAEKYELLASHSYKEIVKQFVDYLLCHKEILSFHLEINEKMSKEHNELYRRKALEKQLEIIQRELHPNQEQKNDKYTRLLKESHIPNYVQKVLLEEAFKLKQGNEQGQDANLLRNYLEFALSLPWKKETPHFPDLWKARAILDENHYGMTKVKERIIQQLAVMKLKNSSKGSALLLVGPPGTGKTSLGKSIAKALNRPYGRVALGGIKDESEIRGHRRTYVGAIAGRLLKTMQQTGKTNPVIVLDEIDKMIPGGFSGDPAAALLEVLDPEQNDSFLDHYLDLPYDLSDVLFIATANSLSGIPSPLLDRLEAIQIDSYTVMEKFEIAKRYMLPTILKDHGIHPSQLEVSDEALYTIIDEYTQEAGCRGLKKQLSTLARIKAVDLAESNNRNFIIHKESLEEILGLPINPPNKARNSNPCGVVTGLAWTETGGKILFIEAVTMPGNSQLVLTGQLGEVMKESAKISLSVLKSKLSMDINLMQKQDIHVHFPAGAIPKDGPSAGIAIFVALASLVLQKPVDSSIAMTGELSLSGCVLPIGGLKEKLLGAMRAGIKKVLIPWDNRSNLREVPSEVLNTLEIIPVQTAEDVLRETLEVTLPGFSNCYVADTRKIQIPQYFKNENRK